MCLISRPSYTVVKVRLDDSKRTVRGSPLVANPENDTELYMKRIRNSLLNLAVLLTNLIASASIDLESTFGFPLRFAP